MNMQSTALVADKVVVIEEFRQAFGEKPIPCLTPDLEQRLVRKLKKRIKDPLLAKDVWKDIVAELWPKKPEPEKPVFVGKVLDFALGQPRKRNNAKECNARRTRARSKQRAPSPNASKYSKAPKAGLVSEWLRKESRLEREQRRAAEKADAARQKAARNEYHAVLKALFAPPRSKKNNVENTVEPERKRKRRGTVSRSRKLIDVSVLNEVELLPVQKEEETVLNEVEFLSAQKEEETAFDRNLCEKEAALAAERALLPQEAPKPKNKTERVSKLKSAEKSRQQAELREQREKQKVEAQSLPEHQPNATDLVPVVKSPPAKPGLTKKQQAIEAKKRKPKRHAKPASANAVVKSPKRGELVSQLLRERIRDLTVELNATEMYLPMAASMQEAFEAYQERAAMALSRAKAGQAAIRNITKAEDNILFMLELSEWAYHTDVDTFGIRRFQMEMEAPSINPLLTLAGLLARVIRIPV